MNTTASAQSTKFFIVCCVHKLSNSTEQAMTDPNTWSHKVEVAISRADVANLTTVSMTLTTRVEVSLEVLGQTRL